MRFFILPIFRLIVFFTISTHISRYDPMFGIVEFIFGADPILFWVVCCSFS